jgi:hypothetical protein
MVWYQYIEIAILIFSFILFLLFLLTIRKNSENIFFSMRSSNLMQITNLSIFLSILVYGLSDIFYPNLFETKNILSYIPSLYFLFQIITFLSLVLRYHRLYISCKINSLSRDELLQFKFFEAKPYHYEYFYVRIMALFILVIIISSSIFYYTTKNEIMESFEILNNNNSQDKTKVEINNQYYFWMILSFIETIVFITYSLLSVKIHISPNVNILKEVIFLAITNYLYFVSIGFSVLDPIKEKISEKIILYFPFLYNLLVLFVTLGLPFLWGRYNDTVINYDLPGELTSSLYLFLTKEKCFDLFHNYLFYKGKNSRKAIFYLDMLINIFKYRMLIFTNQPNESITEMENIERMYLRRNNTLKYFDDNLVKDMTDACRDTRINPKINTFDPITNVIYEYLEGEFKNFTKTEEFEALRNDLREETYVRCRLVNYGLIRN